MKIDTVEFERLVQLMLKNATMDMDREYAENLVKEVLKTFYIEVED